MTRIWPSKLLVPEVDAEQRNGSFKFVAEERKIGIPRTETSLSDRQGIGAS